MIKNITKTDILLPWIWNSESASPIETHVCELPQFRRPISTLLNLLDI